MNLLETNGATATQKQIENIEKVKINSAQR